MIRQAPLDPQPESRGMPPERPEDMLTRLSRHDAAFPADGVLRIQRDIGRSLVLENDRVAQMRSSVTAGCSAAFTVGKLRGFASLPESSDAALRLAIDEAAQNLRLLRPDRPPQPPRVGAAPALGIADYRTVRPRLSPTERAGFLRALRGRIARRYHDVTTVMALDEICTEKALVSSTGARAFCASPRISLTIGLTVRSSAGASRLFEVLTLFGELEDNLEALALGVASSIDKLYDDTRRKIEGVHPAAGLHDIVLAPGISGVLAHEAVGHPCEADHVLMGSAFSGKLGHRIASDKINLVDHGGRGFDGKAQTAFHVDDEGVPCQDLSLIRNGVLTGFMHNRQSADAMETASTGNARAGTYADEPLIRMRNTALLPGTDRIEDMIASTECGYLIDRPGAAQADLNGELSIGVLSGYEIRDGKIGRALKDTTITGNAFATLGAVTHVGDDFTWVGAAWCAKGQTLAVSMGGPSIKTRAHVGGR